MQPFQHTCSQVIFISVTSDARSLPFSSWSVVSTICSVFPVLFDDCLVLADAILLPSSVCMPTLFSEWINSKLLRLELLQFLR